MSLQALAHNMAAKGRGPDSTLVHMSPREVHGLQALAMAHGGSLTINPHTGLPEAGFLDSLLPAIAGFALNAFLPGVGGAIGGALGLTGAAASTVGTGLLVGGTAGLATGSLEKGLMAGLGAYGGAGLGSSLNAAGTTALNAAESSRGAFLPGAETTPAGTLDRLKAGFGSAMNAPQDFMKSNLMNLGLASAPLLAGSFDSQSPSASKIHSGYIRKYEKDPVTGALYQVSATPADQYTEGSIYGGVPEPVKYAASGGLMQNYDDGGVIYGGVGLPDLTGVNMNNTKSDSQRVQDYLAGTGPNPYLFYHKQPTPIEKAAEATKEIAQIVEGQRERGGGPGSPAERADARGADSGMSGLRSIGLSLANSGVPGVTSLGDRMLSIAERQNAALANNTVTDPAQRAANNGIGDGLGNPGTSFGGVQAPGELGRGISGTTGTGNDGLGGTDGVSGVSAGVGEKGRAGMGTSNDGKADNSNDGHPDGNGPGLAQGGIAALADGGMYNLGSYSDGGRLLRGPGDGVSDDIPATIGQNQPARLADGEFVVPARIVSELGNGSTEAGARKLYAMMDRVQKSRSKTVGKDRVAANTRADKYLPA